MLRYLVAVLFLGSAIAEEAAQNGRIVGGRVAGRGQFPFQASLRNARHVHICGAVIVSDRWLLTAAHCTLGVQANELRVVVGSVDNDEGGESYNLRQVIEHPDFNQELLYNDVALLQTAYPITLSKFVQPARMADRAMPSGQVATTCGWGSTWYGGATSRLLQFFAVRTLTNESCRQKHSPKNRLRITDDNVCTFSREGQGTCMGDSGSPLIVDGVLVGLVSWGIPCAAGMPDVYTRIAGHRAWILKTTGIQA